jgi:hypothetical protein
MIITWLTPRIDDRMREIVGPSGSLFSLDKSGQYNEGGGVSGIFISEPAFTVRFLNWNVC